MERLFEAEIETTLQARAILDHIAALLGTRRRSIVSFGMLDRCTLENALNEVEEEIMTSLAMNEAKNDSVAAI